LKNKIYLILFIGLLGACTPQQWTVASQAEDLIVKTSWEELSAPSEEVATMRLNVWVQNQGKSPVEYDLGFEFFLNGKQVESSNGGRLCAKPGVSYKGKMSGVYFEPVGISQAQINDSLITVDLLPLNVLKVANCTR
jgi:hypothetical protein